MATTTRRKLAYWVLGIAVLCVLLSLEKGVQEHAGMPEGRTLEQHCYAFEQIIEAATMALARETDPQWIEAHRNMIATAERDKRRSRCP